MHFEAHASLGWLVGHVGENSRRLRTWCVIVKFIFAPALSAWILAVHGAELPPGFVAETLATNLNAATAIAPAPDGRIFIADQTGRVLLWKDGRLSDRPALMLHVTDYWERGLIGLTLHPDFPRTPHLFALYVTDRPFVHHVLSRFTVPANPSETIDPASEQVLFEGDDQARLGGSVPAGHQGGPVRFGPDGKLYLGLGEQTAGEPAQHLGTLQGKILRLNADGSIPEDNPLLTQTRGKYGAIYAYGIRNPYGMAWQRESRRIYFTDVGGSAFEEVNELMAGANYGWPRAEGYSTNATFRSPLHAYSPLVGQSIVGGAFLPRASTWPQKWRGRFFFADFMKHWIKALDPDAPTNVLTFARGLNGPVATEVAPDDSLLVLNRGAVWRDPKKFVPNSGSLIRIRFVGEQTAGRDPSTASSRPGEMAALGLPMDATQLPPRLTRAEWEGHFRNSRRWPVWISSRAWHDLAGESPSGLYLPPGARATLADLNAAVQLPPGAVVVREFSLSRALRDHSPKTDASRPIETRLLVIGSPRSYGASYRWRTENEAELIEDGELVTFNDVDVSEREERPDALPKAGSFSWWFPGLDDALTLPITNPSYWISTAASDFVVPPPDSLSPAPVNWLAAMLRNDALATPLAPNAISNLPPGTIWENPRLPPEARVRSYLHGNCAVCHQPGGASRGWFDARLSTPLAQAGIINGLLAAGDLGIPGAKVVVPGSPETSILYRRLKATDFFRMPPVQTHNQPSPILPVLEEWIRSLR